MYERVTRGTRIKDLIKLQVFLYHRTCLWYYSTSFSSFLFIVSLAQY